MKSSGTTPPLRQVDRTYVISGGRRLSYFGGCDYYRLASHPAVLKAVSTGLRKHGLTTSASRVTTGNHLLFEKLEHALASFFHVQAAVLAGNGAAPCLMVAQALAGQFSHVLLDDRAHGSLLDAAQLLDRPVLRFKHRDPADLARQLHRLSQARPIVLTDGMFSHDGSAAPLREYLAVLPTDGMLLVDDAHGAGVLGPNGRGTVEIEQVPTTRIIQTISLSKAFGVFGGAVLCSRQLRTAILERSRTFAGNTPLPLPLVNAALTSIALLKSGKTLRTRLFRNADDVKTALRNAGIPIPNHPGPIISIVPKTSQHAKRITHHLLEHRIHPPFIHYPGGPASGYYRFVISSEHTTAQLDALVRAISKANAGLRPSSATASSPRSGIRN